jgi:DNA-binding response OmpR family regulator
MLPPLHRVAALHSANRGSLSVRVLLISDGRPANETLMAALRDAGHEWFLSQDLSAPWRLARGEMDIALYDLGDADDCGWQVLDRWRHLVDLPLLVLGPCMGDVHAVKALRLGADGYLPNPPSPVVLLAYMEAMLRRARQDLVRRAGGESPAKGSSSMSPTSGLWSVLAAWICRRPSAGC